ncbi:L-threonine 3-dehydrogenase [Alkaliphilus peptidifermentans]|uniref:L-threonine 3-dehydrogenase n=1 Tax=Alkaliphilus peptidifermentans DSM 18978 TaxID=1120976 RepID=A0A1G5K2P5_9FIRM|nr:L-threonine 3-dehydrogenase [Alkaliphilus peptidifermentans]SCY94915.1 L-threonine 3-dehydrogenase [Alkaliphilus peptidifermentans DSM 18978]
MEGQMKVIIKAEAGEGAELSEMKIPQIGPKDVLVKVLATSICGTDYHIYSWDEWSKKRIKPPYVMGHEFAGEVIEIGKDVTAIKVGDIISAETHIVCGVCDLCTTGNAHICKDTAILGVDTNGTYAEYVAIPESNAWKNPKGIDPAYLAVQEPLGNAVHTVMAGEIIGKTIAVVGCGPIGIMAVAVAKAVSAAKVIAIEVNEYRLDLAGKLGADILINPLEEDPVKRILEETNGLGVDVVAEMSGNALAIQQALKYIKLGGRMSLLGIPTKEVSIDLANDVVFKGITMQGIVGRKMYDTWFQVKGLIESGNLNLEPIITHRLPMEDFKEGFELMKQGNCGKVVLYPNNEILDNFRK